MPSEPKQDLGNSLDLVDIKEIKEDVVILKDGGLRQVVMVGGVNFALKSDSEQNLLIQGYQTFLNGIDFPLQIVIHSRKVNTDKYIESLLKRKDVEESPILQNQIEEYVEFIKSFVEKNAIMEKVFLVVVPFYGNAILASTAKSVSGTFSFLSKKQKNPEKDAKAQEENEKNFEENVSQLKQRTGQVTNGLMSIGLEATILDNEALIELFYNFYNPQTIERQSIPTAAEQ
jgi:type IV secretory pathway VirB4 component